MKFKVGDKVRVRKEFDDNGVHANKQFIIDEYDSSDNTYFCKETEWAYKIWFSEEMLEPAYAEGGYIPYGKLSTPSNPIPIEEQLGYTIRDSLDSAFDAWRKLGGATSLFHENTISIKEDKPMKFTFYTEEGYRIDKSNNSKVETITTFVKINGFDNTYLGMATCDKVDYSEREGVINALANAMCNGNFDREFNKAVKDNARADKKARTCTYCGQLFDTVEEKQAHEAWHVECRKARHERYLLRKRAKEIAFEEAAQKLAKEIIAEDNKK